MLVLLFIILLKNLTDDYNAGAGANDLTATRVEQILLDKKKQIVFEEETLDLKRLGARYEDGNVLVSDSLASS